MTFTQNILISADTVITREHNGAILWVDIKLPESQEGWRLKFDAAANLTDGGPFLCRVKKYHVGGTQPVIMSNVGEKVDRIHDRIFLRQTQEYCDVSAFVHPVDGPSLFTFGASINSGATGHRTINVPAYNINPQDFDVLHKCVPSSIPANLGGPQAINIVLPSIVDLVGTNPPPGSGISYNTKDILIMKCDGSPYQISIACRGPDQAQRQIHTVDGSSSIVAVLTQPMECVWLRGGGDGWWGGKTLGIARAPGW